MQYSRSITPTILNQTYKFAEIYGRMQVLDHSRPWLKRLAEITNQRSGYSAVSIDQSMPSSLFNSIKLDDMGKHLDESEFKEYLFYVSTFQKIPQLGLGVEDIDIKFIRQLHADILNLELASTSAEFRSNKRLLPKAVWENGVYKTVSLEVNTKPEEIESKLTEFLSWLKTEFSKVNPLILAAICHYRLAEIHPFADGNGRLSRVFERIILHLKGISLQNLITIEDFYLKHREKYYDLIEWTISNGDLSQWLEFYTEGMLESIVDTAETLRQISGGTIDIINCELLELTEREEELIDILNEMGQASGADIAKRLRVSRQNIHRIISRLDERGILKKIGSSTSARYALKTV